MALLNKSTEATGVDTSLVKVIIVGVLGVVLAGACGYFLNTILEGALELMPLIAVTGLFFIVFLLQIFFIKSSKIINIIVLLESVAITLPFFLKFSGGVLLAWILLFGIWMAVVYRGRKELDNQLKIKFSRVERSVMPFAFTAFAIFVAILSVWVNGTILTKERFNILIRPTQPIIQSLLSESFSFNMTIAKFAEVMLENKLGINVSALPTAAKNMAVNQVLNQFRTQYGLTFKSTDTFSDVIYNYMMSWLNKVPESISAAIPLSAGLLIFLTVKGISFFLRWVVMVIAFIIYEFALLTGFSHKALESRSREIISL